MANRLSTTGRRLSSNALRIRMRSSISATSKKPILHLRRSSYSQDQSVNDEDDEDEASMILDPVIEKNGPTELRAPNQVYETPLWRHIWTEWDSVVTSSCFMLNSTAILRFPYLCARYGGIAFLVSYLAVTIFLAIPSIFLELIVGQFTRSGSLSSWKLCPIFKGVGICFLFINFLSTFLNNAMATWSISYVVTVLESVFGAHEYAWSQCENDWNSKNCIPFDSNRRLQPSRYDSNAEYFRGFILGQKNRGNNATLANLNVPNPGLGLTLAAVTLLTFLSTAMIGSKGLPRFSTVLMAMSGSCIMFLAVRGSALPGAVDGVRFYMKPDWNELFRLDTWFQAARCAFATYGIGIGVHLTHASLNSFGSSFFSNILKSAGLSMFYSTLNALAVFSFFGFSARIHGKDMKDIVPTEPEFLFEYFHINYDIALPSHFCHSLFYLSICFTAVYGTMARLINIRLCFDDTCGRVSWRPILKYFVMAMLMLLTYICTIPLISNVALSWIRYCQLSIDGIAQPFLLFMELFIFSFIFGMKALNECHEAMVGTTATLAFHISWKFLCPSFAFTIMILGILKTCSQPGRQDPFGPLWARLIGIYLITTMFLIIIITGILTFVKFHDATGKLKLLLLISPDYEWKEIQASKDGSRGHLIGFLCIRTHGEVTIREQKHEYTGIRISVKKEGSAEKTSFPSPDSTAIAFASVEPESVETANKSQEKEETLNSPNLTNELESFEKPTDNSSHPPPEVRHRKELFRLLSKRKRKRQRVGLVQKGNEAIS